VFDAVQTFEGRRSLATRISALGKGGFTLEARSEEAQVVRTHAERLGWVAIEYGDARTPAGRTFQVFAARVGDRPTEVRYPAPCGRAFANVIAGVGEMFAEDPVVLRFDDVSDRRVRLRLQEDQSFDTETRHPPETVLLFVGD
jgi:hypothetical protein